MRELTDSNGQFSGVERNDGHEIGCDDGEGVIVKRCMDPIVDARVDESQAVRLARCQRGLGLLAAVFRGHGSVDEDVVCDWGAVCVVCT